MLASLVETCKINAVEPQAYFNDVITKLINSHLQSRLDELLPWAYAPRHPPSSLDRHAAMASARPWPQSAA